MTDNDHQLSKLNSEEIDNLTIFALLPPPISLDTFVEFNKLSPVTILNSLDNLIKKEWICCYEPSGIGHYALCLPEKAYTILKFAKKQKIDLQSQALINHIENSDSSDTEKKLTITNICYYSDICYKPDYILKAAEHCQKIGATEAATAYYSLILDSLKTDDCCDQNDWCIYIDAVLGIVSSHGHRTPLGQQRQLLSRALKFSKKLNDPARLCRVDLHLAQVAKREGDYEQSGKLNQEAWEIAKKLNNENLYRQAALFTSDFLFWQGYISEAVKRYEDAIGDLEQFPADAPTLIGCATLGWCYGICGQTARGISLIEEVRKKAKKQKFFHVIRYTDIMSVLTLFDARRLKEAEIFLNNFFSNPKKDFGNYELWAGYASKAFILYTQNDLQGCYEYQTKAYNKSKEFGWFHHRGPWNFDYMAALEDAGLIHPAMNYESEVNRLNDWPDIYMKGVGLRYQAQRMLKEGLSLDTILPKLEKSIELLTESGAKIELAHAQILLARLKIKVGIETQARDLLNEAWLVVSGINPTLFPQELKPYVEEDQKEDYFLSILFDVGDAIGTVRSHKRLLERIINLVLKVTKAGRGGIFLFGQDNELSLMASRNLDIAILESQEFKLSYNMVNEVFQKGREITYEGDTADQNEPQHFGTGWRIAFPIKRQDHILGVIYLDNDLLWAIPPKECLLVLKVIASQVAVALENAEAYEEIARLKERLEDETRFYREEFDCLPNNSDIIGKSNIIQDVLIQIKKVSPTDSSVLIVGETGVGKELVAKALHRQSNRRDGPFIPVNCAALDPGLIASELFGHEKGAFTGASRLRRGRFELADGGTLFLDDIDTLPSEIQAKILRTLQEKEFERVGADKTISSNFRLLAATNQNLEEMIEKGLFRRDLYFRLKVFPIHIPPLRERKKDIPLLALHFLDQLNNKFGKKIKGLKKHHINKLLDYEWIGNVRELKHIMERAVILSEGENLELPDLIPARRNEIPDDNIMTMKDMERKHVLKALKQCGGRVSGKGGAAEILDIKPTTLYARIRKLEIHKKLT
ncbi:MAG: sigma 54-interacting transcriptional regulator [Desulfobacula sp.]|uniref:sigma-54-dependent Fis family transcriptional regulator n=1 Tax=Desulfobacula sp. TaxID=2593537 RepID=UPI0025BF5538|nr:sigma 54-interacting transcriptional regulator [Desulfobacula sp.]MCD4721684.1 sigma 54-interacting transcriptional regulator [Desulfobacula sp.]